MDFRGRRRISRERGATWDGEALRSTSAAQLFWLPLVLFVLTGILRFPSFLSAVPNLLPTDYSCRPDDLSYFAGLCIRPRFQETLVASRWNYHSRTFLFPGLGIFIS